MAIPLFSIGKERSVTVGTSSTEVLPANSGRVFARITNDSDETIYLMLHEKAQLNYGIRLEKATLPNNFWEINNTNLYIGSVNAICASGGKVLLAVENTSTPSFSSSSSSSSSSSESSSSSSSSSMSSSSSSSFSSSSSSSSFSSSSSSSSFSSSSSSSSFSSSSSSFSSSSSSSSLSSSSSSSSFSSSSSSSSFSSSFSSSSSSSSSSFSSSSSSSASICGGNTRFEYYITGDDTDGIIFSDDYKAQTFTPSATHVLECVGLKLSRIGTGANVLTVEITATTGGDPSGAVLASGSIDTSIITGTPAWYSISMGATEYLNTGTKYAIVVSQNGAVADTIYWRYNNSDATYTGGTFVASDDAGTTWVQDTDADFMFEEYGTASSSSSSSSFSSSSSSSSFSSSSSSSSFSSSSSSSSLSSSSSSSSFSSSSSSSSFSSSSSSLSFSSSSSSSSSSFSSSSSSSSFSSSSSSFSSSSSSSSFSSSSSSSSSSFSSSSSSSSFSSSSSSSSFSSSSSSSSLTLYESYTTGEDTGQDIYGNNWRAQSFTPSVGHTVEALRLKLAREGVSSQTLTVSIKAVDGDGDPTGADLASGTLATSGITDTPIWYDINLGAGTLLTGSTQYAIIVRQDGVYADRVYWRYDSTGATYAGGVFIMSDDAGTSWIQNSGADFMFEEYGS